MGGFLKGGDMKSIAAIVVFLVAACGTGNAWGARKALEIVTLQYPPYEFEEKGEIRGVAVAIVREVFRKMNRPVTISLYPWARSLEMANKGEADAIFTIYRTPERESFLDYSNEVIMTQIVSLFVLKQSTVQFNGDLATLKRYGFGKVRGVSYGKIFDRAVKEKIIDDLDDSNDGEQNMEKLLLGRFDIMVCNKYGAIDILNKLKASHLVRELAPEIERVPSYIAFSKKKNLTRVRDQFDVTLKKMKASGEYDRLINEYFRPK